MDKKPKEIAEDTAYNIDEEQRGINFGLMKFRKERPEFAKAFMDMWRKSKEGEALPLKYRELIALAIVLVQHCKPCIFLHTKICIEVGATREEILETAEIAVAMG
ncbi:carboxymuconolactone decarboxylase family protein, partial [candidate division WOR-3 bacterium]|nr:carboxymuconolactone decarboxylase family protein [candidate division WOR-3 bacterium]